MRDIVIKSFLLVIVFFLGENAFASKAVYSNLSSSYRYIRGNKAVRIVVDNPSARVGLVSIADSLKVGVLNKGYEKQAVKDFSDYTEPIPNSEQSIEMAAIEGGTFLMGPGVDKQGSGKSGGPPHKVKVDSLWMGKYEITWNQYNLFVREALPKLKKQIKKKFGEPVVSADAISTPTPPYTDMSYGMGKDQKPAINMTHYAAVMFTKWLTAQTGHFYRLPTEAEWEYACRAGSETAYHFGKDLDKLGRYAWYRANSNKQYHDVGTKDPNAFGLYDMHGNVAEWTMDQYHENYFEKLKEEPAVNPWFKPTKLYPRTVRGGSWQGTAEEQRCTRRRGSKPKWKLLDPQMPKSLWWLTNASFLGFRVVRPAQTPPPEKMKEYWIKAMEDLH